MQNRVLHATLAAVFAVALCTGAHAAVCSTATTAGDWGFSYSGVALTPSGQIPVASAGRYTQDASGNVSGTEVFNLAGTAFNQTIRGTFSVHADCTAELRANIYQNGQLVRTSVLDGVFVENSSEVRAVFRSAVLPDGTHLPVVITVEGKRLSGME